MSSLLFLSTRVQDGDENYNASWSINLPRLNTIHSYKLSLQNIEFPNTVYPINVYNKNIYFNEGGVTLQAVLTENNYTGSQFAAEVKAQLDIASGGGQLYTVTYDSQAKKLLITAPGNFQFEDGAFNSYDELGFNVENFTSSASYLSDYTINLSGTSFVDVVTNFSTHNHSVSTTAGVLVRVPVNVTFGNIVFYEPSTDDNLFVTTNQIDNIFVQLRDERGNLFLLPRNTHLSMTLKLDTVVDGQQVRLNAF